MRRAKNWDEQYKKPWESVKPQKKRLPKDICGWNSQTWRELRSKTQALADAAAPKVDNDEA